MNVGQVFPNVALAIGLACAASLAVIIVAKLGRSRRAARSRIMLAPYRRSLITLVAGEDDDGQAKAELSEVPVATWALLSPTVVSFLAKVRGVPADDLGDLMRSHGEVARARRMLTARSEVERARSVYLLGLVRDPDCVTLLPLLGDPSADVRMVSARALGNIGDPAAAAAVLEALRTHHGQIGIPAWIAAEALLAMGMGVGPALLTGLASQDAAVRNVCAMVVGHSNYRAAAPQLRTLLASDPERDVRVSAARALGRVGGDPDAAALALGAGPKASEPAVLRRTCATALGELGYRQSMAALVELLGDDDRRLAELAADSLVRIGSEGIDRLQAASVAPEQGPCARAAAAALEVAGLRGQLVARAVAS